MKINLREKILLMFIVIIMLSLSLNSLTSILSFREDFKKALYAKVVVVGEGLRDNIRNILLLGLQLNQIDGMDDTCQNLVTAHAEIGYIAIVTTAGEILYHNDRKLIGQKQANPVELKAAQTKTILVQPYDRGGKIFFDVAVPIFGAAKNHAGTIRLGLFAHPVNAAVWQLIFKSLASSLFSLIIAFILIIRFVNVSISKPLKQLVAMLNEIASGGGDLTKRIHITSKDEIGELAALFNKFIASMNRMISHVRMTADKVTQSSENLSASAEEMNSSNISISSTIQMVAKGVATQAAKIETASQVMNEMSASLKQVSFGAHAADELSQKTLHIAREGTHLANNTMDRMKKLNLVIGMSSQMVTTLTDRSKHIFEIVDVLTGIADQTNLLALNAAIEAARAGESGRGFAVVADEVRKLAEGSAASAKDIVRLVNEIEKETEAAADSMKAGTEEVAAGVKMVTDVEQSLIQIMRASEEASQMVAQIAVATSQQLDGAHKIASSVNEIASIAQNSASASQEATASTQQQTASMQEMASSSQELFRLASELKTLVSKFKLEE